MLFDRLNVAHPSLNCTKATFHARCFSHVINLVVEDCIREIHQLVETIQDLMNAVKASVKRNNLYKSLKKKVNNYVAMPGQDYKTQRSSALEMVCK